MENSDSKLVSVILIDDRNHFLAPLTIDSILAQEEKNFEVIVLTKNIMFSDLHSLREYKNEIKIVTLKGNQSVSQMRNMAMKMASGVYLHYLFPGEVYLSKYSLNYVKRKLQNKDFPDLLCFSYLKRDLQLAPEVKHVSFSLSCLGGERYPLLTRDTFILRKSLVDIKGFNPKYVSMEGFDVIVRMHLKKGSKVLCCRRVIVDHEMQKLLPKVMLKNISEIISIIYKQYGIYRFFHWPVIREMFEFVLYWLKGIKNYFMQVD